MQNPPDGAWQPVSDRALSYLLLAALVTYAVCFVGYCHVTSFVYRLDDAYINYEYVSNFVAGHGLVFNEGERIWAYTSPLQILLLAIPVWAGFDPPAVGTTLSILWISCTSYAVYRVARWVLPGPWSFLIALYFLTYGHAIDTMGLETALLVLLQVSFLWAACRRKSVAAAALGGLSCLARPDSVLLVLPILLASRDSRRPRNLALFALPGAVWLLFALAYYGDVFPRSLYAKAQGEPPAIVLAWGLIRSTTLASPLEATLQGLSAWNPIETSVHVALWLFALVNTRVRGSFALVYAMMVYPCLLIGAYALIGSAHYWEFHSAYFFFKLGCLVGLFTAVEGILRGLLPGGGPSVRVVGGTIATAWIAFAAVGWSRGFDRIEANRREVHCRTFEAISAWINENVEDGASVQALEVGTLGYLTDVRIVDSVGLVTEGITFRRHRMDMVAIAREFRPDYLLLWGDRTVLAVGPSLSYRTVKVFPDLGYQLMRRDDASREPGEGP
jgi:hypothetical protein